MEEILLSINSDNQRKSMCQSGSGYLCCLLVGVMVLSGVDKLLAQSKEPTRIFRLYEDNDILNIRGNGSDRSYTNGLGFDLFYIKNHASRFFIDRWMPKAGDNSIDVFGWGLMQKMVTPNDLSKTENQPDDYQYAGVLYLTHTLLSYNPSRKYSVQTEILFGIRGPASLARETQTLVHRLTNLQEPMGWDNQLKTKPLVNISFTAEKQLLRLGNFVEINGGAELAAGNMLQAIGFYPMIRIGKMTPYFDGFLSQYSSDRKAKKGKRSQFYLLFKPVTTFVLRNALMHGESMSGDKPDQNGSTETSNRRVRHRLSEIEYGAVFTHGRLGLSFTQTHSTEYNKGLYHHGVGNISIFLSY